MYSARLVLMSHHAVAVELEERPEAGAFNRCPIMQFRLMWKKGVRLEMARDFTHFDNIVGSLVRFEDECGILSHLAPGGSMEGVRKVLSYEGAIRFGRTGLRSKNDGIYRDPGNYCYGVLLRSMGLSGTKCKWSNWQYSNVYNDEKLGDIFEAALGLAWRKRHGMDLPTLTFSDEHIDKLAELIEVGALATESVINHTVAMGIWENSKDLAAQLM